MGQRIRRYRWMVSEANAAAAPLSGHQVADRIGLGKGLQPGRHRLRLDEDVAHEGEREQEGEPDAHHRARTAHDESESQPHPREPEREEQDEPDRREDAHDPARWRFTPL